MYKDVAKRILASVLTICMIGSTPDLTLLADTTEEATSTEHTYAYGSEELITTNNFISAGGWIANAYEVESNNDSTNNGQELQSVAFALDKEAQYGDGAACIDSASYTIDVLTAIQFADTDTTMIVGEEKTLGVIYTPTTTSQRELNWSSNNEAVATVDATGKITAKSVGNATITATSKDKTDVSTNINIEVCKDIKNLTYSPIADQTYQGIELTPGFEIKDGDKLLSAENGAYTAEYSNNQKVGTANVKVTANGNGYKGEHDFTFKIIQAPMGDGNVVATCNKAYDYTGSEITIESPKEDLEVTYKNENGDILPLTYKEDGTADYKIREYKNNVNVGNQAIAVLEGTGNYTGTLECTFVIKASEDAEDIKAVADTPSFIYDGSAHKSNITVTYGEKKLQEGVDYKVIYPEDIINAGTKTVTITGIGAYASYEKEVTYKIVPRNLNNNVVFAQLPNQLAGVTAETLKGLQVTYGGKELVKDKDFTLAVAEVNGEVTVTLSGIGNFQNEISQTVSSSNVNIEECKVEVEEAVYTGAALEPKLTITDDKGKVVEPENYFLTWSNNTNAGTASVVVSAKEAYAGEQKVDFTIKPRNIGDLKIDYETSVVYYKPASANDGIVSVPTIKHGSYTLKEDTDYTVSYENHTGVTSDAKMIITGKGNYGADVTKTYSITVASLEASNITYEGDWEKGYTYTGSAIEPKVIVKQNKVELEAGKDYDITFENNKNEGLAKMYFTGINNYAGSQYKIDFTIGKFGLANATIDEIGDQKYTGEEIKPDVKVSVEGVSLNAGTDYDVEYSKNVEAGLGLATITGKGNYTGTRIMTFKIVKDINDATVKLEDIPAQNYAGSDVKPDVLMMDFYKDGTSYTLQKDTDYTLSYLNNNGIGTATVRITGQGHYEGTIDKTFIIQKGNMEGNSDLKATLVNANPNALRFTGSNVEPEIQVTCSGNVLTKGKDYTIQYFNNKNVMNAGATRAKITGMGNFGGSYIVNFTILPKDITFDSSISISVAPIDALTLEEKGYPTVTIKDMDRAVNTGDKIVAGAIGGYLLEKGEAKDYTIGEVKVEADGQATVEIIGQNNYSGSVKVPFVVNKADVGGSSKVKVQAALPEEQKSVVYTGKNPDLSPVVTMTVDGTAITLTKDVDYTVSTDAVNVGSGYKYTVKFIGKYNGTYVAEDTFSIIKKDIAAEDVVLDAIQNQAYTGSAITPEVTLRYNNSVIDGSNYTVTYENNIEIGDAAKVTITGQNNFEGTRTATFQIRQNIANELSVTGLEDAFVYTSKEVKPYVMVTAAGKKLNYGVDYTLDYENNINVNEKEGQKPSYVIVKGIGAYGGEKRFAFTIKRKNMLDDDVKVIVEDAEFTGGVIQPKVKITYTLPDGSEYTLLDKNTENQIRDYDVSVGSGSQVGQEVTVTITPSGINFYTETGSFVKKFNILPKSLVDKEQHLLTDYTISHVEEVQFEEGKTKYELDEIVLQDMSRNPNGQPQESGTTFYALKQDVDYTITYSNNTRPGTATYVIKGMGNYTGSYTGEFTILGSMESAVVSIEDQIYTGNPITPNFTVSFGDMMLKKDVDYKYEFSNNVDVGKAVLKIIGIGSYVGSQKEQTFTIQPKSISDADVIMTHVYGSYTYTGDNIHPDPHFTYNNKNLVNGTDFTCVYADECNKSGQWFTFTVTGTGNFTGTLQKEYKIGENYTKETIDVKLSGYSFEYTGEPIEPTVSVHPKSDPSATLEQNVAYQFEYEDNVNAGTAHVNTWGDSRQSIYAGDISVDFEITPKSVKDEDIQVASVESKTYSRGAIEPKPSVTWKGKELIEGEDFNYTYRNNTEVGTAVVVIQGIGNFKDTKEVEFTIQKKDIAEGASGITVEDIENQIYTGNAVEPKMTLMWDGKALDARADYTCTYENNMKIGQALVTIQGIGNYTGTVKKVFNIIKVPVEHMEVEYQKAWKYTGNAIEPSVKIFYQDEKGTRTQMDEKEFAITYSNSINVGEETGVITIMGKGNCEGTKKCFYTIQQRELTDTTVSISEIPNQVLDEENKAEPKPVIVFRPDSKTNYILVEGVDYKVNYSNNTVAGTNGTVTVTGLNNFTGTLSKEFFIGTDIKQYIESIEFVEEPNYTYNGMAQLPEIKVNLKKGGSADLVEGRDYEILYDGQKKESITDDAFATKAGTHSVSVHGLTPYGGGIELTYDIQKRALSEVNFEIGNQSYTGSEIHPFIVGTDAKSNTRLGEDASTATITGDISKEGMLSNEGAFTTKYEGNCTNIGKATVIITAVGESNYTGSVTLQFEILPKDLQSEDITSSTVEKQNYTGNAIKPGVVLTDSRRNEDGQIYNPKEDSKYYTLVEGTDYDVIYTDNIYPGSVAMTIIGKNHYTNTLEKQFEIAADLVNAKIAAIPVQKYQDGETITPELTVTLGDRILNKEFDYTVAYSNNRELGTATATVLPVAGSLFTGSQKITFEISNNIENPDKPGDPYGPMNPNDPYEPSDPNDPYEPVEPGDPNDPADPGDPYGPAGPSDPKDPINPDTSAKLTAQTVKLVMADTNFIYTGSPVTPEVTVIYNSIWRLTEGVDYILTYENNVVIGSATVRITGIGEYSGAVIGKFNIVKRSILQCTFDNVKEKVYTGNVTNQKLVVTDGNVKLIENQDYLITYRNNINPGIATMEISGMGNYEGAKTIHYLIYVRDMSKVYAKAHSKSVELAWTAVPGAGGYAIYNSNNKLLVKTTATSYKMKKLKSMKNYTYKVRPYVVSDGITYYGDFSNTVNIMTRPSKPSVKLSAGTEKVRVTWKKIKGVNGYEVYRSAKKNGKYMKVATVKKVSSIRYTNKNLIRNKRYYYKVRAYKTVSGKRYYSKYSSIKSTKVK